MLHLTGLNRGLIVIALGILPLFLAGCASEQITRNETDTGSNLGDLPAQRTLVGIAKIRYYHLAQVWPDDFEISKATVTLNDTISGTAGSSLGGVHGLVVPMVAVTPSRVAQNSVDMVISNDPILLSKQALILSLVAKDESTYRDGTPNDGCLFGKYENHNGPTSRTVWVDNNPTDMNRLTALVGALMGDTTIHPEDIMSKGALNLLSKEDRSKINSAIASVQTQRNKQPHTSPPKGGTSSSPSFIAQ